MLQGEITSLSSSVDAPVSTCTQHDGAVASEKVLRLEAFVSDMLQPHLIKLYNEREAIYNQIAQCTQLRHLFDDMASLSGSEQHAMKSTNDDKQVESTSIVNTSQKIEHNSGKQKNTLLVDLSNHFYTPAKVHHAQRVHINIGCNVILEMSVEESTRFLRKKESVLRQIASQKTREVLQMKYRIRLVTEMITRLHERDRAQVSNAQEESV